MKKKFFCILLIVIALFGVGYRLVDYDSIPPYAETQDEFFYPWAGMTWLRTGNPTAWSWFPSYQERNVITKWGIMFPIVSPWLEKPPLYSLIQGTWMIANGYEDIFAVRLAVVRIIPIMISFFTIILTGLLAKKVFSKPVGVLSALLFATIPTIVMANRLSMTENLLTPLALFTLLAFLSSQPIWVALGAFLMLLTKNISLAFVAVLLLLYFQQKKWRSLLIVLLFATISTLIHPLIGAIYDWKLFTGVIQDYRHEFARSGLPELVNTLFLHPTIGRKDHFFLDGSMLAGYILLFSSPFWALTAQGKKTLPFLAYPFAYIAFLAILASGVGFSFYGWHVYPLYPFLVILLAKVLVDLWRDFNPLALITSVLILGSSAVRLAFMFLPKPIHVYWQHMLASLVFLAIVAWITPNKRIRQVILYGLLLLYVGVNIYTSVNLSSIIPPVPQPLQ